MGLRVANGPVSWGVDLPDKPGAPPWEEVFSEISQAGFRWCELGPVGYLPDDDDRVRAELDARGLSVAGSYIFEPMHDRDRHDEIADITHLTCHRIAALGGAYLVVIDMVSEQRGATAGRSAAAPRLGGRPYQALLTGLRQAAGIAIEHGLTPVLHPHVGSYIEFEDEIERVLTDTVDDGLQLCIDTGHLAYAGVEPVGFLAEHRDRTPYLHFKDLDPVVHHKVLNDEIAFFDAVSLGVFCPVGRGSVDFAALATELEHGFDGPGTIEQDRDFRSPTTPLEDAKASLEYLRGLGLAD
ncbi:MAG: sugar phosphate isomerase/epimerase [Actinomycetota bacterium]|nr:sugar phosphate isomerase/epimerase [Actinomycetota bacterium]